MKRNYFLPALFVAAAFTACTQEELVVNNATNDTFEVVGGKLLGDGFTADLNSVSATRVGLDESGNAKYVEGDKAGIGWVVGNGAVNADQTSVLLPNVYNTLYANHMLLHDGKRFNSHSNVYEGWHFAYRPYQYMQKPSMLTVKVNPELAVAGTDENLKVDQYDKMPSFSNAAFVDGDKVDEETGMVEVEFPLQFIANAIRPVLNVDAKFTENEPYNGLAITGITLSAGDGNNIFADELLVQPKGLKEIEDAEGKANVISEEYFGDDKAFKPVTLTNSVKTVINHESYTLGEPTSTARMFLAPTQTAGDLSDLSFRIDVETGYFLIDASDADATNKASIAMMQAMLKGGYTSDKGTKFDLTKLGNKIKTVPLNLTAENFHTDYVVSNYDEWTKCVTLANTLATESVEFVLAADADITFDSENPMTPTVGNLTLKIADGGDPQITIDGEVTWPTNITVKNNGNTDWLTVTVNPEAVLLVNSTLNGYVRIVNNGTIKAESAAYLGGGLRNKNEVVVALGAGIHENAEFGKISYIVPLNYDLEAIQTLIGSAHVNNLKIGKGYELNCASPLDLGGIHLEINGGTVTSEGYAVTAESVTLAGGSITNVDVAKDMTVKEVADANSYAGELNVAGNVIVEAKAALSMENVSIAGALTNDGNVQISADLCTTIGSIVNNGTLKATTDVYVETITLGESSVTTIESGKTIWYSDNDPEFKQNGTTSGKIEYYNVDSKFADDLAAAKEGDVVVLMKNETILDCSAISAGVTIKGLSKDYTLRIGGTQQMKFAENVTIENLTIEGTSTYEDAVDYTDYDKYIVFAGDAVFNNVEFKTPVAVAGNATFEGCTFAATGSHSSYYLWIADYGKTIEVENCVFNSTRSITILDDFSVFNVAGTEAPVKLNISGTTFNTTQKGAVMAGQAVEVNWGDGNVVPANVEGKEVWIRYEYYKDAPNNIQNVKVIGCGINIEGA